MIEELLAWHAKCPTPEGWPVEVLAGTIVIGPPGGRRNALIHDKLRTQLERFLPGNLAVGANLTLDMVATSERYVPDLVVAAPETLRSDDRLLAAADAELVAEIVSPRSDHQDRVVKLHGYAASDVPVYLLVDPLEQAVTVYSRPAGESYLELRRVPFGVPVPLPAPFDGEVDTGQFD